MLSVARGHLLICTRISNRSKYRVRSSKEEPPWEGAFKKAVSFAQNFKNDLPIIGLITKLTTPTGSTGEYEMSYQEYARSIYDTIDAEMNLACCDLEEIHGEPAQLRFILCICWMANSAFGEIPAKAIARGALRLHGSSDLEYEVEQFEVLQQEERQKYGFGEVIDYTPKNVIPTVVDGLTRLVLGAKEDVIVDDKTQELLTTVISHVYPNTLILDIEDAFKQRSKRAQLYK